MVVDFHPAECLSDEINETGSMKKKGPFFQTDRSLVGGPGFVSTFHLHVCLSFPFLSGELTSLA